MNAPAHLQIFVEALGEEKAVEFLLAFGGARLHIPVKPTPRSELVTVLGEEAATALAKRRDSIPAEIPTGKKWIAQRLHAAGLSQMKIARRLHVTRATVHRYISPDTAQSSQPSLFD